jgi:UDP-perosamine 4-acetyltransferase
MPASIHKFLILGAGGHAGILLQVMNSAQLPFEPIGYIDRTPSNRIPDKNGLTVVGTDDDLPRFHAQGVSHLLLGVGSIRSSQLRQTLFEKGLNFGFHFISPIDPSALIAPGVILGHGCQIMPGAIINNGARIGDNVIVNSGAIIEHDCIIGSHCHISPGAVLAAGVKVGQGSHIGAGAVIRQGIDIGENAVIGIGAAVVKPVQSATTVVGVPARPLSS